MFRNGQLRHGVRTEARGTRNVSCEMGDPTGGGLGVGSFKTNGYPGIPSLKRTGIAPENACLEYDCFFLGWPIFHGLLLV